MKLNWWADTLFKRLFVLMWLSLVLSSVVAFNVVTQGPWGGPPPGPGHNTGLTLSTGPVLPSLPPTPGLPGGPPPEPSQGQGAPHGLPTPLLLLDYGIRLLIIGAASWWGARWLSAPMQRLVEASQSLASAIGRDGALPELDQTRGTAEVREAAQVFNAMAQQLGQQYRSRALMVAALSHDLRTPLTRVRLRLESLQAEPAAQRCIADIREMDALIDAVLEVFRESSLSEPSQVTHVLAMVQSLGDDLVEQGHTVTTDGDAAVIETQPVALRRVLSNLINNAVRYGGLARVSVVEAEDGLRVTVDDDGPGIAPEHLEAVFQPFYRLETSRNRQTGGTGLGLYIARDLVQRQRGSLRLSNRPEGGLRATVFLPRSPP